MTLQVGDRAPDFSMPTVSGGTVSLSGLRGKKVVLYFYPKDDTPGCTTEACSFRDNLPSFQGINAEVIGVSRDNTESHRAFRDKYGLNFTLASDDTGQVTENYGVWREKNMYGKTFMGIQRSTFLIDENGTIAKIWPTVQVDGHTQEVLAALNGQAAPDKPAATPAVSPSPIATKILAGFQSAPAAKPTPAAKAKPKREAPAKKKAAAKKKPAKKAAAKPTKKAAAKKKPVKKKSVKKSASRKTAKKAKKKPTKKATVRTAARKTAKKKPAKRAAARSGARRAARRPARRATAARRRR